MNANVVGLACLPSGEGFGHGWRTLWCCESHVELALEVGLREVAVELGFAFIEGCVERQRYELGMRQRVGVGGGFGVDVGAELGWGEEVRLGVVDEVLDRSFAPEGLAVGGGEFFVESLDVAEDFEQIAGVVQFVALGAGQRVGDRQGTGKLGRGVD